MLRKPDLTDEQKIKFKEHLENIVKQSSHDVQTLWNNNDSIIWVMNTPTIESNVHLKLKGKQSSEYVDLKNKLDNRDL